MTRHLLVVLEKKIKMLKTAYLKKKKSSIIGGTTINFCTQNKYLNEIRVHYLQKISLKVTLRTDDTGQWTAC